MAKATSKGSALAKIDPPTYALALHIAEEELALLDAKVKEMRARLLENLTSQGVRRVDLENGDSYVIAHRDSLIIKNERAAFAWANENPEARMKLDTSAALKVVKMGGIKWAAIEPKEYLRITRAKVHEQNEE